MLLLKHALSSTLSILIPGKTNKGLTDAAVCWSFQTSLENTTLKNSGVGSKRLIKPSLSRPENGQSRAKQGLRVPDGDERSIYSHCDDPADARPTNLMLLLKHSLSSTLFILVPGKTK